MNLRRNVRASLDESVLLSGTDRWGNPFEIKGKSLDFSRKGLGLLVNRDIVAPGATISLDLPNKLRSSAVVQWTRPDSDTGSVRLGVRLVNPQATLRFRLAACCLLSLALLSQLTYARQKGFARSTPGYPCTMGLSQMRSAIQSALGKYGLITESEKAFIHIQHQRMSCEEFTREFEKSGFYADERKRRAIADWHWQTYHAPDEAVRASAIQSAEVTLGGTH